MALKPKQMTSSGVQPKEKVICSKSGRKIGSVELIKKQLCLQILVYGQYKTF